MRVGPDFGMLAAAVMALCLCGGCLPKHDLDKAAGGSVAFESVTSRGGAGGATTVSDAGVPDAPDPAGLPEVRHDGGTSAASGGMAGQSSVATGGQTGGSDAASRGGSAGDGGAGSMGGFAPPLPEIVNSPVTGTIYYSSGASWDIDGTQWPAFEIHTPTAHYWLVKAAAAIVSINDTSGVQWINFSSGFRPNRGVPNLGGCCQPGNPEKLGLPRMSTVVDPSFTVTSTHLRLISTSADEGYRLVWDFFLSHFTLTVDRAAQPFGFTYRGVPAGAIHSTDKLVLSNGEGLSPSSPYSGVLSGEAKWAYYDYVQGKRALFLIQHQGDALTNSYQIPDGDTAMWTFGGDQSKRTITRTPLRFSLGLVDSADDAVIRERIRFVISAIN